MTSILKVDQLQDSGGNALITSDGAGNLTAGTIPAKTIGTGAVLQVVSTKTNAQVTVSTVSVETHVHQSSITTTSTSSKILVLANINGIASGAANANRVQFRVRWDTSSGGTSGTEVAGSHSATNGTAVQEITSSSLAALVSPSSTSQLYFKVTVYTHDTGNTRYVNIYSSDTAVTLLEIAG